MEVKFEGAAPDAAEGTYAVRPFRAAWWLQGPHAQTVGGKFLRRPPAMELTRERLESPDGDFVDLDFTEAPARAVDVPVVLVLHGLEGSARRRYMLLTYRELAARGIRAVGLNFRSCSGERNRLARFYHSGETDDLRFVLGHLRRRFPNAPVGAVGFSLGGNALLKLLGEEGDGAPALLDAAAAVSVPFDLAEGARRLEEGLMGHIYTEYFMRMLRQKMRAKADLLDERVELRSVLAARTLREFDDAATAPLHGFEDADDYYRRSSAAGFVGSIRIPTLILHAADDPFLPGAAIPREAVARTPHITAAFTERGGHVGFIEGTPWAPRFWAESETARFLAARLTDPSGLAERREESFDVRENAGTRKPSESRSSG